VLNAQVADASGRIDPFLERMFGHLKIEGGLGGTRPLRLRGDALKLVAQPRPPALRTGDWLPAQQLTLEDTWRPADKVIAVGQPLTRQLRIAAVGQSASQLPDLSALAAMPAGLKSHAEEATLSDQVLDGHVVGQRDQDVVVLADQPGRYEVPELRLTWWDVVSNQRREAVLPAVTVEVVAAANPASASTSALTAPGADVQAPPGAPSASSSAEPAANTPAASSAPFETTDSGSASAAWVWVSVALALLWLGTLGAWAWSHRRRHRVMQSDPAQPAALTSAIPAAQARETFHKACRSHAARPARDALIAWARSTWRNDAPVGLNALARRLDNPVLTELLRELDRACIANTAWNGDALARSLPALPPRATKEQTHELPDLYGDSR
jgi:hypothetical protein